MVDKAAETGGQSLYLEILTLFGIMLAVSSLIRLFTELSAFCILRGNFTNPQKLIFQVRMYLSMSQIPLTIAAALIYSKWIQKRPLWTLGFRKGAWWKEGLAGALTGFAMMTVLVLTCLAVGALKLEAVQPLTPALSGMLVFSLLCFVVQGLSEEILFRGLFLTSLARKKGNLWAAVVVSALAFAVSHLFNRGLAPLPFCNLFLFGVLAGLCFLKRGSIYAIAGLHALWNFTQGNLWGVLVSGSSFGPHLAAMQIQPEWKLLNGGSFGLEGGLLCSLILILGIGLLILLPQKAYRPQA